MSMGEPIEFPNWLPRNCSRQFSAKTLQVVVSLDEVAAIIQRTVDERAQQDTKLLDTYDTVISSIHQLATPPEFARNASPEDLRSLLGERWTPFGPSPRRRLR